MVVFALPIITFLQYWHYHGFFPRRSYLLRVPDKWQECMKSDGSFHFVNCKFIVVEWIHWWVYRRWLCRWVVIVQFFEKFFPPSQVFTGRPHKVSIHFLDVPLSVLSIWYQVWYSCLDAASSKSAATLFQQASRSVFNICHTSQFRCQYCLRSMCLVCFHLSTRIRYLTKIHGCVQQQFGGQRGAALSMIACDTCCSSLSKSSE